MVAITSPSVIKQDQMDSLVELVLGIFVCLPLLYIAYEDIEDASRSAIRKGSTTSE